MTVMDFQLGYSPADLTSPLIEYLDQVGDSDAVSCLISAWYSDVIAVCACAVRACVLACVCVVCCVFLFRVAWEAISLREYPHACRQSCCNYPLLYCCCPCCGCSRSHPTIPRLALVLVRFVALPGGVRDGHSCRRRSGAGHVQVEIPHIL